MRQEILLQVRELFDALRQALAAQFHDLLVADAAAAGAVFSEGGAAVAAEACSSVSPFAKRLLTKEEIAMLTAAAQSLAAQARGAWVSHQERLQAVTGAPDPERARSAQTGMIGATAQFTARLRNRYYVAKSVLTAEQQAALRDYYRSMSEAEGNTTMEGSSR